MFLSQEPKILLSDLVKHLLIRTPLENYAHKLQFLLKSRQRARHPELQEIYLESSRIEEIMRRVIHKSSNCIDVGCHLGSMLSKIIEFSPNGSHIAFEPTPYKAHWLKKKFPEVNISEIALSDKTGETSFYQNVSNSGYNGLRPHKTAKDNIIHFIVRSELLDNVVDLQKSIDFIKIDVEGGELAVLRGATKILRSYHPIVLFECSKSGLSCFDFKPIQIFEFLTDQHGYSIFLLKDFLSDGEPLNFARFNEAMQYPFQAFNFIAIANI